jgi:uncharacterized protein
MTILQYIIQETQLSSKSVENTISLLNEDATIPFIARYRKELTGNLDEVQIGEIVKHKEIFEALEKRKKAILKALEEQNVLTSELAQKITNSKDIIALEDLYLPFKKKRKTKAETARLQGLEPLAKMIMSQRVNDLDYTASKYIKNYV